MSYGRLEQRDGRWQLRFTRRLAHPPERVWRALVDPDEVATWFPTTIEGDCAPGAPLRFAFRNDEGAPFEGEMIACDPPHLMEFRWGDDDTLRFELEADGHGTVLTLVDTFGELGKAARDAAGWHVCLDALTSRFGGEDVSEPAADRWHQVHEHYLQRLGPEAATIGPPDG
jgi:uncharacterized protein YndB with AHSA1/START domain